MKTFTPGTVVVAAMPSLSTDLPRGRKIAQRMLRRGQQQQGLWMARHDAQDLLRLRRRARGIGGEEPFGEG